MKTFLKNLAICLLLSAGFAGCTALASYSMYRQDVRNCMNDSEQTEASCEAKYK